MLQNVYSSGHVRKSDYTAKQILVELGFAFEPSSLPFLCHLMTFCYSPSCCISIPNSFCPLHLSSFHLLIMCFTRYFAVLYFFRSLIHSCFVPCLLSFLSCISFVCFFLASSISVTISVFLAFSSGSGLHYMALSLSLLGRLHL